MNVKNNIFLIIILSIVLGGCFQSKQGMENSGFFTDERDGQIYPWKKIGYYTWMTQNLNYDGVKSYSIHSDSALFGRLYGFREALMACPDGWHLSTDSEWAQLELTLGMSHHELYGPHFSRASGTVGKKLFAEGAWNNNSAHLDSLSGFDLLPAGFYWPARDSVRAKGYGTVLWTSSTGKVRNPIYRELQSEGYVVRRHTSRNQAFSIRCVRD